MDRLHGVDSTGRRLSGAGSEWARFPAKVCGAKARVIYGAERPKAEKKPPARAVCLPVLSVKKDRAQSSRS